MNPLPKVLWSIRVEVLRARLIMTHPEERYLKLLAFGSNYLPTLRLVNPVEGVDH